MCMQEDIQSNFVSFSPKTLTQEQILELQIALVELAPCPMLIRGLDSRVLAWNQGAQVLYGWTEQEALGQITHTLLQTRFPESCEAVDFALERMGYWEGQLVHRCRDGKQVIVQSRQILVRKWVDQPIAILEINFDVSEQEQLRQEQAQARIRELALQEATRQMEAFLGLVSHELKTPLTTVRATLQLAKRRLTALKQQEAVSQGRLTSILDAIENLLNRADHQTSLQDRLINDLIDVSRIHAHQLNLQVMVCDLVEIVREVVVDQRMVLPHRTIHWDSSIEVAEVVADAVRVKQVINNYLSNALRYSPVGTPVDIRLMREETLARVEVVDEGLGLSEEQQKWVWDLFTRVGEIDVKRESGAGLGLGLYICRNLIEQQAGQVGVKSKPGYGSTFWFTLPLAPHSAVSGTYLEEEQSDDREQGQCG